MTCKQVKLGMDVAASEFYKAEEKKYDLNFKVQPNDGSVSFCWWPCSLPSSAWSSQQTMDGTSLTDLYASFVADYPMVSIEDPFDQVCSGTCTYCEHGGDVWNTCKVCDLG